LAIDVLLGVGDDGINPYGYIIRLVSGQKAKSGGRKSLGECAALSFILNPFMQLLKPSKHPD